MNRLPRVPCGSVGLPEEGIKHIEKEADLFYKYASEHTTKKVVSVNSNTLIKANTTLPLQIQSDVRLGDRVGIVTNESPVPFGMQGTVVAVKGKKVDIVLDTETIGGTDMGKMYGAAVKTGEREN